MKTCPNCKQIVDDGSLFCPHCGFAVGADNSSPPIVEKPIGPPTRTKYIVRRRDKGEWETDKDGLREWFGSKKIQPMDEIFDPDTQTWCYARYYNYDDDKEQKNESHESLPSFAPKPEPQVQKPVPVYIPPGATTNLPDYLIRPEQLRTLWGWWLLLSITGTLLLPLYGIGIILLIPASIVGFILMYRFWFIIQSSNPRTTPGKAVGYCFIPFYNIYWWYVVWVGLAQDTNSHCRKNNIDPGINETMALIYYVLMLLNLIPYVGLLTVIPCIILGAIFMKQLVETAIVIIRRGAFRTDNHLTLKA